MIPDFIDVDKARNEMIKENKNPREIKYTLEIYNEGNKANSKIKNLVRSLPDIAELKDCPKKEETIDKIANNHFNNMSLYRSEKVGMGSFWIYRWSKNRFGNIPFVVDTLAKYFSQDNTPRKISWDMVEKNFNIGILSRENLLEIRNRIYYNNNLVFQANGEYLYTITENEYEDKVKYYSDTAYKIRKIEADYYAEERRLKQELYSEDMDRFF